MSVSELKKLIDQTTIEERVFMGAYLEHLAREADSGNGRDLDRRWEEMESGKKISLTNALMLHEELKAKGI